MAGTDHTAERTHHAAEGRLFKRLLARGVAVPGHLLDGSLGDFLEAFLTHHPAGGLERGTPRGLAHLSGFLRDGTRRSLTTEPQHALQATHVLDGAHGAGTEVLECEVFPLAGSPLRVTDLAERRKPGQCSLSDGVVERPGGVDRLHPAQARRAQLEPAAGDQERCCVPHGRSDGQPGLVDHVLDRVDLGRVAELHVLGEARERVVVPAGDVPDDFANTANHAGHAPLEAGLEPVGSDVDAEAAGDVLRVKTAGLAHAGDNLGIRQPFGLGELSADVFKRGHWRSLAYMLACILPHRQVGPAVTGSAFPLRRRQQPEARILDVVLVPLGHPNRAGGCFQTAGGLLGGRTESRGAGA